MEKRAFWESNDEILILGVKSQKPPKRVILRTNWQKKCDKYQNLKQNNQLPRQRRG